MLIHIDSLLIHLLLEYYLILWAVRYMLRGIMGSEVLCCGESCRDDGIVILLVMKISTRTGGLSTY